MIRLLRYFTWIPFINRLINRKYYATGFGTYIINSFFKRVLLVSKGDLLLHFTSRMNTPENFIIENKENNSSVFLSLASSGSCYYQAINGIYVKEGTIWAYGCQFISSNHSFKDLSVNTPGKPIKIGKKVWIAANVVILPEVEIGDYSVIGAGSIVTTPIPPYSIAVGNPAKVIAKRCHTCHDKIRKDNITNLCGACANLND